MINIFAGTPSGTTIEMDISKVYLGNLQITGTSGLKRHHQEDILSKFHQGKIDINTPISAVGGMKAAAEAIRAAEERRYPGKIIVYPQIVDLPVMSVLAIKEEYPSVGEKLKDGYHWTSAAERELMDIHGISIESNS